MINLLKYRICNSQLHKVLISFCCVTAKNEFWRASALAQNNDWNRRTMHLAEARLLTNCHKSVNCFKGKLRRVQVAVLLSDEPRGICINSFQTRLTSASTTPWEKILRRKLLNRFSIQVRKWSCFWTDLWCYSSEARGIFDRCENFVYGRQWIVSAVKSNWVPEPFAVLQTSRSSHYTR